MLQKNGQRIRRRPAPGCAVEGPARMPAGVDEFTGRELGAVLGVSGREAGEMLYLARTARAVRAVPAGAATVVPALEAPARMAAARASRGPRRRPGRWPG